MRHLDHWKPQAVRPPSEGSLFTVNYVALRGLKMFGTTGQQERILQRTAQVRQWMLNTPAGETEDRVFRLRSLHLAALDGLPANDDAAFREIGFLANLRHHVPFFAVRAEQRGRDELRTDIGLGKGGNRNAPRCAGRGCLRHDKPSDRRLGCLAPGRRHIHPQALSQRYRERVSCALGSKADFGEVQEYEAEDRRRILLGFKTGVGSKLVGRVAEALFQRGIAAVFFGWGDPVHVAGSMVFQFVSAANENGGEGTNRTYLDPWNGPTTVLKTARATRHPSLSGGGYGKNIEHRTSNIER